METLDRIQKVLSKKFNMNPETINPESTLESLGLDSLSVIELLFDLEDEFKVSIPEDPAQGRPQTVGEVVHLLDKVMLAGA